MSQKNETAILVLALLTTAGLLASGFWWVTKKSGINIEALADRSKLDQRNLGSGKTSSILRSASGQNTDENFAAVQNVPTGLFNYGGSTSWAPIRLTIDSAIQAARPEFRLRYVELTSESPGSSTGIRMLIDDRLAFAQSSRPVLDQEITRAQQRGFSLKQIPVGIDDLAIAVNPNLNIPGLTIEQLKSIYIGSLTNWKQLGDPDLKIEPLSRPTSDDGTIELFAQDILGNQPFGSNVKFVSTTTQALQKLVRSPGGIYYPLRQKSCRSVQSSPCR